MQRERERAIYRYSSKLMFLKFGKNTRKTEMFQNFQKSYFYITFLDNCFWICWKISTAPTTSFPTFIWKPGKGWMEGRPIQKINFSIIRCFAHVVRCGCVGWVSRTLWKNTFNDVRIGWLLMTMNLFLHHVHFMYYIHQSKDI